MSVSEVQSGLLYIGHGTISIDATRNSLEPLET